MKLTEHGYPVYSYIIATEQVLLNIALGKRPPWPQSQGPQVELITCSDSKPPTHAEPGFGIKTNGQI
jgi:hypothetical protein